MDTPVHERPESDPTLQRVLDRFDTVCGRCGYNLRRTDLARSGGACPECGLEVSVRTLLGGADRGEILRQARRLKRLTRGLSWVVGALVVAWVAMAVVVRLLG